MKKSLLIVLSLICAMALQSCASPQPIPVVAQCPRLPPAPAEAMIKRLPLSAGALQADLLDDTPITTK